MYFSFLYIFITPSENLSCFNNTSGNNFYCLQNKKLVIFVFGDYQQDIQYE